MVAKVKHPVRAAYARFTPIYNHLTNMADYLDQAAAVCDGPAAEDFADWAMSIRALEKELGLLERKIKPFREK